MNDAVSSRSTSSPSRVDDHQTARGSEAASIGTDPTTAQVLADEPTSVDLLLRGPTAADRLRGDGRTIASAAFGPWGASEYREPARRLSDELPVEEVTVVMQTFIPYETVGPLPNAGLNVERDRSLWVHGDGASHTRPGTDPSYLDDQGFRTQQIITLQYGASGDLVGWKDNISRVGESATFYDEAGTRLRARDTASAEPEQPGNVERLIQDISQNADGSVTIDYYNETRIPDSVVPRGLGVVGAPGITNNTDVTISPYRGQAQPLAVTTSGEHDRFPAYEIVVQRNAPDALASDPDNSWTLVHGSHPEDHGDGKYGYGPRGLIDNPIPFSDFSVVPPQS